MKSRYSLAGEEMIKADDVILICDDDKPAALGRVNFVIQTTKQDEFHVEVGLMKISPKSVPCFLSKRGFWVNGKKMNYKLVDIDAINEKRSNKKNALQKNDTVLVYFNDKPVVLGEVQDIAKAEKFGFYNLKLSTLEYNNFILIYELRRKDLDAGRFKSGEYTIKLKPVEVNVEGIRLERFKGHQPTKGRKRKEGDVVLICIEGIARWHARIKSITEDEKPGWYQVNVTLIESQETNFTWTLKEENINGKEFSMGGEKRSLVPIEPFFYSD